jgi:hypothetical protein
MLFACLAGCLQNAKLDRLKTQCAYMRQDRFLAYVRHFLYMEALLREAKVSGAY